MSDLVIPDMSHLPLTADGRKETERAALIALAENAFHDPEHPHAAVEDCFMVAYGTNMETGIPFAAVLTSSDRISAHEVMEMVSSAGPGIAEDF